MSAATIRSLGRALLIVLATVASSAEALEKVEFVVTSGDKALAKALRAASVVLASESEGRTDTQDILSDSRAEYAALLNALYANGHYSAVINVQVDGREVASIAPLDDPAQIRRLKVSVSPGPRFTLSRAILTPLAPRSEVPEGFRSGLPAESGVIIAAAGAGVDGWRARGHAKAQVLGEDLVADHARATLSAEIQIAPGPVLRFGRLAVQGQDRMRERRIRKIAGLPEGDVFDPKELDRAASRLRRTGVFKSVTLTEADSITLPDLLGITATVVEEKPRRYRFGAEVASLDGVNLSASWLHRNLLGGAERLELMAEASNIKSGVSGIDWILGAKLDRPATFTPDTNLGFELTFARLDEADFKADITVLSTTLTHVFSDSLTGRAGLSFERAVVRDEIDKFTYRHLALPLGLTWDRRDTKTDAKRGFFIDAELKPFIGFGITENGVRGKLDMRGYKAFGNEKRFVLAARIQAGAIWGAAALATPRDDLFYSGGAGTVRGQPYQSLGADVLRSTGDTSRIGGSYFLGTSLEARIKATDTIGVVGFVDVGQVGLKGGSGGSSDWHAGAGLGIRYGTAVGPIRLDVAAPVGGRTGDGVQFYLGLGQAF